MTYTELQAVLKSSVFDNDIYLGALARYAHEVAWGYSVEEAFARAIGYAQVLQTKRNDGWKVVPEGAGYMMHWPKYG